MAQAKQKVKLTPKQEYILDMVKNDRTNAQIAEATGTSINNVYGHIKRLREKGLLPKKGRKKIKVNNSETSVGSKVTKPQEVKAPLTATTAAANVIKTISTSVDVLRDRITTINIELEEIDKQRDALTKGEETLRIEVQRADDLIAALGEAGAEIEAVNTEDLY